MPIIQKQKILFKKNLGFIHIPKCGGSSIENLFIGKKKIKIYFLDRKFDKKRFNYLSAPPQHLFFSELKKISKIDVKNIDFFCTSRHPISRFISAYAFNYGNNLIEKELNNINLFVDYFYENLDLIKYKYNRHFMDMWRFIEGNKKIKIYKLENKLDINKIENLVSNFLGIKKIVLPHSNKNFYSTNDEVFNLSANSIEILHEIYKKDFIRFNY